MMIDAKNWFSVYFRFDSKSIFFSFEKKNYNDNLMGPYNNNWTNKQTKWGKKILDKVKLNR